MPFELETENIPVPALPKLGRSSLQQVKRMLYLRWSAGRYLTTIARNKGVTRPALGFSDDDFFRACVQALAVERKTIRGIFAFLLENVLGPYEDETYELARDHVTGEGYVEFESFGDYVPYTNWNATPFTVGERITAVHPVTGLRTLALVKEQDTVLNRIYFVDEALEPGAGRFDVGHRLIGRDSGGEADVAGRVVNRNRYEFPLYGTMKIDPGGPNEEEVTFVAPDPYVGRVRVVEDLANNHSAGEKILIEGGCWDFIETRARRIVIRVTCEEKRRSSFPGNAYFHQPPELEPALRERAVAGATELKLDEQLMEDLVDEVFPIRVLVNPENEHLTNSSPALLVDVASYTQATRTLTLAAPLPAGTRYVGGIRVRIHHAKTGEVLDPVAVSDQTMVCRCRWPRPYGVWTIDLGGGNEEKVFVLGTSYQRRLLAAPFTAASTEIWLNEPLEPIDTSHTPSLVISDDTGPLGVVTIDVNAISTDPRRIVLTGAAGFGAPLTSQTVVEYCRGADFGVTVYLSRPVTLAHAATDTFKEFLGTPAQVPTWDDHLVSAGWPGSLAAPDGRWPGPNIFDPTQRGPYNDQGSGFISMELDRNEPNDARIYLAKTTLHAQYNPGAAVSLPARTWAGVTYIPREVMVADGSFFPPNSVIQNWLTDGTINPTGEPLRVVLSEEGTFGRTPLYLWGRGAPGSGRENVLEVSGVARTHLPGVRVATYTTQVPISGPAGFVGGDPGLNVPDGTVIIDHASSSAEEVDYDTLQAVTPTRALLGFNRGYTPAISHDPFLVGPVDPALVLGVPVVRADDRAVPRKDGYSFPFYLNGGLALYRLRFLVDQVRAAGTQVEFVDEMDRVIPI